MNTSHTKNVQVRSFWNQEYVGLYGSVSTARGVFYKKYADFVLLPSCVQSSYFKNLRESSLQALLQYVDTLSQARRAAYVKFCFFSALELTKELQHVTLILKDNYGYSGLTSQQMNLVKNILEKVWFLKPLWVQQDINHLRERIKLLQKK